MNIIYEQYEQYISCNLIMYNGLYLTTARVILFSLNDSEQYDMNAALSDLPW